MDERPSLGRLAAWSPATIAITVINFAVFALAERSGSTHDVETLIRFGATERIHVWSGEPWRLLTACFLHIGFLHLFWNTWAGLSWCLGTERQVGTWKFLTVYLLSGIAGSAFSLLGHDVVGAGASGALFGIVGLRWVLNYRALGSLSAFFADRKTRGQLVNVGIWFALGLGAISMDNYAHAGGLLAGLALAISLTLPAGQATAQRIGLAVTTVVVATVAWVSVRPIESQVKAREANQAAFEAGKRGDYQEALRLTDALVKDPTTADQVLWVRAQAQLQLGDFVSARDAADRLIRLGQPAWDLRGNALIGLGDLDGGMVAIQRALQLEPKNPAVHDSLARLYELQGNVDGGLIEAEVALAIDPKNAGALMRRGVLHHRRGEYQLAVNDYNAAKANGYQDYILHWDRGLALEQMVRPVEARADFERALQIAPGDWSEHSNCLAAIKRVTAAAAQ